MKSVDRRPAKSKWLLAAGLTLMTPLVITSDSHSAPQEPTNACRTLISRQIDAEINLGRQTALLQAQQQRLGGDRGGNWLGRLFDGALGNSAPSGRVDSDRGAEDRTAPSPREAPRSEPASESGPKAAPKPDAPRAKSATRDSNKRPARSRRSKDESLRSAGKKSHSRPSDAKNDGPSHYTKTNTQELSVDEGDIVKTNGRYIYHVSCNRRGPSAGCRNELRVFESWPARKTKLVGRYTIPARDQASPVVEQIYLYEDSIAVVMRGRSRFGAVNPAELHQGSDAQFAPRASSDPRVVRVVLLDAREPSKLQPIRELYIDGEFVESRMIGSRLYFATSSMQPRLPAQMTSDIRAHLASLGPDAFSQGAPTASQVLAEIDPKWSQFVDIDPGLPRAREWRPSTQWADQDSERIYSCHELAIDDASQGDRLLNLVHLDLADRERVRGTGVSGYSNQSKVYASEGSFYIAAPMAAAHTRGWGSGTRIRKFDLARGGRPEYVASGDVRGQLLNQFSMSEHGGHLRVASSDGWASNNLYVLRTVADRLETVGTLENLGRNERIYAVRLMGAKGYVVTFRRTDPLYTLDLSNPEQPRLVGELKIEGYSNYLHPLDDDHLLAVGQDTDPRGRPLGFHLQIFDVSDPRQPRRSFHEKLDAGSTSGAESDHHAFMFEPQTKTLAMPWKGRNYWGLIAYKVDAKRGFRKLGRVNHAVMYKKYFQKRCARLDVAECGQKNFWWRMFARQDLAVDRVVAIDNHLYSLSPSGVMVHRVGNRLRERASVLVSEPAWRGASPVLSLR